MELKDTRHERTEGTTQVARMVESYTNVPHPRLEATSDGSEMFRSEMTELVADPGDCTLS